MYVSVSLTDLDELADLRPHYVMSQSARNIDDAEQYKFIYYTSCNNGASRSVAEGAIIGARRACSAFACGHGNQANCAQGLQHVHMQAREPG